MLNAEVLRAEQIYKSFSGVSALADVSFDLKKGEVHVLLGENGAGKSTLMKIFSGLYSMDSGAIYIDGAKVSIKSTKDAQDLGISIIYQEFNLVSELSVMQNVFLGRELVRRSGRLDKAEMRRKTREYLSFLKAEIDPDERVGELGVAQQQLVEIAKALSQNAKILIMDEPTATLSENEIQTLFHTIRRLKEKGVSIIYISHRLQELKIVGDRVTVLRDGAVIGTYEMGGISLDEMVHKMVGRTVARERVRLHNTAQKEVALACRGICSGKKLREVSLEVHCGEIVALSGLVGAGRTELVHAIFGVDSIDKGDIYIAGKRISKPAPVKCIQNGLGLLPENRKENGLSLTLPIAQNISQASLGKVSKFGLLALRKEREAAGETIRQLNISCTGTGQYPVFLSGGNQQKVVLGKWLFTKSRILIFDEPTRGIDVGARDEIYRMIDRLAHEGNSILIISSDLPEILTIADRIYVMREGRIVAEIPYEQATQELIISYASGGKEA